ncbi:hypothetical protein B0H12DRAFT_1080251 [Mycena haematopus]|nr:hypothetical protein B0H12DRAFT_1080251 [Mycena haematopus]
MLRVTQGVHFSKCSFLGNHGKITIKGNPAFAGREILPLFSLFEPQNLDVTVTNVASVQFRGPRYALREHSVEMLQVQAMSSLRVRVVGVQGEGGHTISIMFNFGGSACYLEIRQADQLAWHMVVRNGYEGNPGDLRKIQKRRTTHNKKFNTHICSALNQREFIESKAVYVVLQGHRPENLRKFSRGLPSTAERCRGIKFPNGDRVRKVQFVFEVTHQMALRIERNGTVDVADALRRGPVRDPELKSYLESIRAVTLVWTARFGYTRARHGTSTLHQLPVLIASVVPIQRYISSSSMAGRLSTWPVMRDSIVDFKGPQRAARRVRRAGSTGPVRRVADPFRQALEQLFDGTATERICESTAGEMTAVDGATAGVGS